MDHYLFSLMQKTSEYIEDNLFEPLTLDGISAHVNLSKYHLLRLWKGITELGLMAYVRNRRLALSLADLIQNKNTIDFVAAKYGFGCERTYTRAFKEAYGVSPSKWRKSPYPLDILDRFNLDFLTRAGEGLIYFKAIAVLPSFTIAGLEYKVDVKDNQDFQIANRFGTDFAQHHLPRILHPVDKNIYIGYTSILPNESQYTYYQPSTEINDMSIVPKDMKIRQIPAHKYGVFTYVGAHGPEEISSTTLADIWHHVYQIWMPTVKFDLKEAYRFERIDRSRCKDHYSECDLYYPISRL